MGEFRQDLRQGPEGDRGEHPGEVPASSHEPLGNQCLQEDHQVHSMREGDVRGTDRTWHPEEGSQQGQEELSAEFERPGPGVMNKRGKRLLKQATSALKEAEGMWKELMTLVGKHDDLYSGDQHLREKCRTDPIY